MDNKEITNPSMGSNELGRESSDANVTANILAGTDTQLHLAALSGKKHKKNKVGNKEEEKPDNPKGEDSFLQPEETDE